jgi:hypothetical protein
MLNSRGNILFTYIKGFYLMVCKDSRKWSTDRLNGLSSSCTGIHNMQFNRQVPKLKKKKKERRKEKKPAAPILKMKIQVPPKSYYPSTKQQDATSQRITVTTLRISRALFTWFTLVNSAHMGMITRCMMK